MSAVAEKEVAKKVAFKLGTAGAAIDKLNTLRAEKRNLEILVKDIETQYAEVEEALMAKMESEGVDKATGKTASVSVTKSVNGNVEDWTALEAYVHKTKFFHLFQRRLSDPGLREIWDSGKKIPGVVPFTKKRLNLRSL